MQGGTGESVSKELGLRHGKLALAQANCQAMGTTQLQDVTEMLGFDPSSSEGGDKEQTVLKVIIKLVVATP